MTTSDDRAAILDLAHRFDFTIDDGDFDAHTALFADDFSFESSFGNSENTAAYREWVEGFHAQMKEQGGTRHFALNPVVEVDGDTASMKSYLLIVSQGDGSTLGTAVATDTLRRTDDGWKLVKRTLVADANVPTGG